MADQHRDTTKANEEANKAFHKDMPQRPKSAKDTQGANDQANAEFHDDDSQGDIRDNVGGLRGSPD